MANREGSSSRPGSDNENTGTYPIVFRYSHSAAIRAMAELCCVMSLPFSFADSDTFERAMQRGCNPEFKRISRCELIREISKLVKESKLALINDFANLSNKVSIGADVWSDHWRRKHYIQITCHWVDDTWTLQKRLIAFNIFHVQHTVPINISRKIYRILHKYGLTTKVFSISFDNAIANTVGSESIVEVCQRRPSIGANFYHVRCINHILSLCAREGLDALKEEVAPIIEAADYLFCRTSLTKKWARFCKKNGLPPKGFLMHSPNRWNLTCKLLDDTYQYRDALCSFFSQEQCDIHLFPNQWDACSNLRQLLKVFKDVIVELAGVYYPTSVLVVDNCVKIATIFNSLIGCDDLGECVAETKGRWLKYFYEIPNIFLVAKLLDPRVRVSGLELLLGIYYDALFPIKDEDTPIPSVIVGNTKACLYDLFNEYRSKYKEKSVIGSSTGSGDSIDKSLSIRVENLFDELEGKSRKRYVCSSYQELETYFTADFEYVDAEFDILKWWWRRRASFPIMSLIAKDILAVPASIVSANQAFSIEDYSLDERQSELTPWDLENQMLLGDWIKAEDREQEVDDFDGHEESDIVDV